MWPDGDQTGIYKSDLVGGNYQRYGMDFGYQPFPGFRTLFVTTSEQWLSNMPPGGQPDWLRGGRQETLSGL